jgi:ribonuclease HI
MISIYMKCGTLEKSPAICFILKSQKYKWTKANKIKIKLPENSFTKSIAVDALGLIYALKHVKNKYKRKKVSIYTDSNHIHTSLERKNDKFINNTKIEIVNRLRDVTCAFSDIDVRNFDENCEFKEELEHIFIECALDEIELNEKD